MKRFILGTALALLSASALAFHCPKDMKAIDAALAKHPQLSAEQMSEVKKYRAEGEALHKAGKHQESVDTLAKAMKILGI
jgi:outer membrane biogenesis lipoprotein LolB